MLKSAKAKKKVCIHNLPNRKGEYQADFSLEESPSYLKTILKKSKDNHGPIPTEITLVCFFIKENLINRRPNCESYSSFEGVSSNCRIFSANIHTPDSS